MRFRNNTVWILPELAALAKTSDDPRAKQLEEWCAKEMEIYLRSHPNYFLLMPIVYSYLTEEPKDVFNISEDIYEDRGVHYPNAQIRETLKILMSNPRNKVKMQKKNGKNHYYIEN